MAKIVGREQSDICDPIVGWVGHRLIRIVQRAGNPEIASSYLAAPRILNSSPPKSNQTKQPTENQTKSGSVSSILYIRILCTIKIRESNSYLAAQTLYSALIHISYIEHVCVIHCYRFLFPASDLAICWYLASPIWNGGEKIYLCIFVFVRLCICITI